MEEISFQPSTLSTQNTLINTSSFDISIYDQKGPGKYAWICINFQRVDVTLFPGLNSSQTTVPFRQKDWSEHLSIFALRSMGRSAPFP